MAVNFKLVEKHEKKELFVGFHDSFLCLVKLHELTFKYHKNV